MTYSKHLIIALTALGIAACGGGGGFTAGSTSVTPTAAIPNEADAKTITQSVVASPLQVAEVVDDLWEQLSALDLNDPAITCDSGFAADRDISVDITTGQITATFSDCANLTDGIETVAATLNGTMLVDVLPEPSSGYNVKFDFTNFTITVGGIDSILAGDIEIFYNDDTVTETIRVLAANLTYTQVGTLQLQELNQEDQETAGDSRRDTSGALDGLGFTGIVTFNTPVMLNLDKGSGEFTAGTLVINGADGTKITVTDSSDAGMADVAIDTDGDGTDDFPGTQWEWQAADGIFQP